MPKQIKVLITGAGGSGTIEIIKSLKEIGGYYIVGCDANPHAYGLRLTDKSYVVPMGKEKWFQEEIEKILLKERVDYIIPLVDEEIMKFWQIYTDAKILTPNPMFCAICLDKYGTHLELKKHGLPTPRTILGNGVISKGEVVTKLRHGHGSKGVHFQGKKGIINWIAESNKRDNWIIQERIFGTEYTVSVVCALDNKLLAVVPKEVIEKKGITMQGVTRKNTEIEYLCSNIVELMHPSGPFNVQLMMDKYGQPWIFEINPRFSTTVALTIASGINEVDAIIKYAENKKETKYRFIPNLMMNRYYTQDYYGI